MKTAIAPFCEVGCSFANRIDEIPNEIRNKEKKTDAIERRSDNEICYSNLTNNFALFEYLFYGNYLKTIFFRFPIIFALYKLQNISTNSYKK